MPAGLTGNKLRMKRGKKKYRDIVFQSLDTFEFLVAFRTRISFYLIIFSLPTNIRTMFGSKRSEVFHKNIGERRILNEKLFHPN